MKLNIIYPYDATDNGIDIAVYSYVYMNAFNGVAPDPVVVTAVGLARYTGAKAADVKKSMKKFIQMYNNEITEVGSGVYEVKKSFAQSKDEKSVWLPFDDVHAILHTRQYHKFNLLRFYAVVLSTVNLKVQRDRIKGFMNDKSLAYYAAIMNVTPLTISNYIKMLEKMGIFYVFRSAGIHTTNIIGLKEHQTRIELYAIDKGLYEYHSGNRSILQKYNALCRGATYNDKEILTIYEGITSYNKDHPNKSRSLEVFQKYKDILDISKAV